MSITFLSVGAIIFAVYMYFTVWNINNSAKKQRNDWPTNGSEGCDVSKDSKN